MSGRTKVCYDFFLEKVCGKKDYDFVFGTLFSKILSAQTSSFTGTVLRKFCTGSQSEDFISKNPRYLEVLEFLEFYRVSMKNFVWHLYLESVKSGNEFVFFYATREYPIPLSYERILKHNTNLNILKYVVWKAQEDWDEDHLKDVLTPHMRDMITKDKIEIVKYLWETGIPITMKHFVLATKYKSEKTIEFIRGHLSG